MIPFDFRERRVIKIAAGTATGSNRHEDEEQISMSNSGRCKIMRLCWKPPSYTYRKAIDHVLDSLQVLLRGRHLAHVPPGSDMFSALHTHLNSGEEHVDKARGKRPSEKHDRRQIDEGIQEMSEPDSPCTYQCRRRGESKARQLPRSTDIPHCSFTCQIS